MNMFPTLLIVDDEPGILRTLGGLLQDEGFDIRTAPNGFEALKSIEKDPPDLVLLDIWMPGMDGIDILKEIRKTDPHLPVIMITGHGTIDTAVTATKSGAFDFIEKPLSIDKTLITIHNALHFRKLEEENRFLKKKNLDRHAVTGNSKSIQLLRLQILQAASSDAPVLILGENGTGKELVANNLHQLSPRSEENMVRINCASISPERIDAELFGVEKNFSEGLARHKGSVEMAHRGTLFLDQIADLPLASQGNLLRFLEDKSFHRVGGSREIRVDVRILAAANRDLEQEIQAGNFRQDLFYRLAVLPITVPPLRERKEDIPELSEFFLKEAALRGKMTQKKLTHDAMGILMQHDWPGNVRELKNLMERLSIKVGGEKISVSLLKEQGLAPSFPGDPMTAKAYKNAMEIFSKLYLQKQLADHGGNFDEAAADCGLDPEKFQELLNS